MSEQRPTGRISGMHIVAVPVTEQDKALAFYTGMLGFETRVDTPIPELGSRWIEVAPPGASVSVALVQASDAAPVGGEFGIRFTTTDAVSLHADLTEAGVDVGELLNWPGVPPMFAFRDQDGNDLKIVQS